jgi:CheY-like chemotaxis protein/HPt (histidine-containing phosphotransfer) domain-containing protein/two-component sensor histidine kinase
MTAAEAELRARLAEVERAAETRARVVGHVAHEFRTPLSSILGFAALLSADEELAPERRREFVDIIHRNARHLLHVVNDILNLTKVEAGTLEVTLAPVCAGQTASVVADSLRTVADERGITLRVDDRGTPPAMTDAGRLRQVLLNLVDNAIKYSPPGTEVALTVRAEAGEVWVEVADQGPGLTEGDQELIFHEYSRIHHPGAARVAGAGLGLALARSLAEAMGGRIGVRSRIGEGSTFWVALPAAAGTPAPAPAPPAVATRTRTRTGTVAVVDDDGDIRAYATAVLQRVGYAVHADDGSRGAAERIAAARPLMVLLDLNLEERSGAELLAELRTRPGMDAVTVLAFTAAVAEADRSGAAEAGFDGHVSKPIDPESLLARVDEAVAESRRRAPAPAPAAADAEEEFWAPLRARFRAGVPGRLAELEAALAEGDRTAVARHLHKLRGTSAGYGFMTLAEGATAAEEALRAGHDLAASPAVASLLSELRAIAASGS